MNYVDLPHTPRYFFGHGLSYTRFAYSDFTASAAKIRPDEPLTLSVTVRNTGGRAGDEVVQLYVSDRYASQTRPVQELVGFYRLPLEPGEQKTLRFLLDPSQLAFLDRDMRWKIEKGAFEFRVGGSSENVCGLVTVHIAEDAWIDGKNRALFASAQVL